MNQRGGSVRLNNQNLLGLGIILFVLGIVVWVIPIPIPFTDADQFIRLSMIILMITLILIVAGIVFIVIALIKRNKETKQNNREIQSATAAVMSVQVQAEYNRRLASFCKGGIDADEYTQAKLFAQAAQTLSLLAPSTAVFADLNEMIIAMENGMYTVTGWVDAQNNYGVMIRTPFTLAVFKVNGTWHTSFA